MDFFYANFQKATKMMITTYPNKILFNADRLTRDQHGEYTNVFVKGHNFNAMLKNGWGEWMATKAPSTMKPGKKYGLYAVQIDRVNNYQVNSEVYKLATVTMGPSTKPVIKSVKISNVKVKRYFSYNEFRSLVKLDQYPKISSLPTATLTLLRDKILLLLDYDVEYHIAKWENLISNIKKVAEKKDVILVVKDAA